MGNIQRKDEFCALKPIYGVYTEKYKLLPAAGMRNFHAVLNLQYNDIIEQRLDRK